MSPVPAVDFKSVFETSPGLYLILTPDLTIVAVSDPYLEATLTKREAILGKPLFEVFPDNPDDKTADGVYNLRASLNAVLTLGKPHKMAIQKYDIRKPDGVFEERFWSPLNSPVFNNQNKIEYIIHNVVDVTVSLRQKEKLKQSESNYQLLINSVKDYAFFMLNVDGTIASWNSGAERIKGYNEDEIIGRSIDLFYTAEDVEKGIPKINLQTALQNGRVEAEGWRRKKDGSLFWANSIITALRDDNGELYGYSKITRDITEKKKVQQQVEILSYQINKSNDAIYTVDNKYIIRSWNHGAEKLYGFTAEEAIGKDSKTILRTAIEQEEINRALREITEKDYWSGELKRKTKDGRDIYVLSSNTTIRDHNGVVTGYTAVSFDITEQKRLREEIKHLADLVEQSSEAIISRGIDQRMQSWNKGAEVLFGYTREEAIGKTALELGILKMPEKEIEAIGREIIEKGSMTSERDFFHKNGTSFVGSFSTNTVKNEQGEVSSIVFIIKDISLQKQLELQLKKSNEDLEEKVKIRTAQIIKTESRFRTLIENNNDIIVLTDASFKIIYRSPSAMRITGWTNEEMRLINFTEKIYQDDRKKITAIYRECLTKPGKHLNITYRTYNKYGECLYMEGIMINMLCEEHVKAIVLNLRDVTQRKNAEQAIKKSFEEKQVLAERMSIILNTLPANIALLNSTGEIVEINDSWRNFSDANAFIGPGYCNGFNYLNVVKQVAGEGKEDAVKIASGIKEVLKNKMKEFVYEYTCHTARLQRWFRMVVTPLQDKEYAGAVVMHIDISELRQLEQERLKSKMAEQKKIAKAIITGQEKERNYLGRELHDNINQILTGTKMFLGMAAKKNKEVKELVKYPIELVDSSIEEIHRLCYKMVTPQTNVQLQQLIQELLDNIKETTAAGTEFIYNADNESLPDDLKLNIYRIMQELINNIFKYAAAKNVKIVIKTDGNAVDIAVSDDGKGFNIEKKGKGIGISNIINRVKSFNGEIEIKSAAGKGCVTTITIPY
jgi:PAS domain S-box-containing protein